MNYYSDVYLKRLNRYGSDYQARSRNKRIAVFEDLLKKSIYRVDFDYDGESQPGLLERYKQDDTQTLQYLLTRVDLHMPSGTILTIEDQDGRTKKWMVYWLEYIEVSGYNRYIVIQINHTIKWTHDWGKQSPVWWESDVYFFGRRRLKQYDSTVQDSALYFEDTNVYTILMPIDSRLVKDDYLEITNNGLVQPYRVLGIDNVSTDGVQFITVDPIYHYDKTPDPVTKDTSDDYGWMSGKFKEG